MPADEGADGRLRLSGWVFLDPVLCAMVQASRSRLRLIGHPVIRRGHVFILLSHTCFGVLPDEGMSSARPFEGLHACR